jgi:hypothetical protein
MRRRTGGRSVVANTTPIRRQTGRPLPLCGPYGAVSTRPADRAQPRANGGLAHPRGRASLRRLPEPRKPWIDDEHQATPSTFDFTRLPLSTGKAKEVT